MKAAGKKTHTLTIGAGEFKAKCLQLMDEVKATGLTLIVTKRGEAVVEIGPALSGEKPFRSVVGRSPLINIPSVAEWKRLKTELSADWSEPGDKLVRVAKGKPSRKKRRA